MPRAARVVSESGYYHVMLRRAGKQFLFEDDSDRHAFLSELRIVRDVTGIVVIAWCLMDNHVHLILHDPYGKLSTAVHKLALMYAQHFNNRSGHVGHVFQNRFKSIPIESDCYLLELVRYVHNNPARAGICSADCYRWSSYAQYAWGRKGLADTTIVLDMLGGRQGFRDFVASDPLATAEGSEDAVLKEIALKTRADEVTNMNSSSIGQLPKVDRDDKIRELSKAGVSIRQIERLTGIGQNTIRRALLAG